MVSKVIVDTDILSEIFSGINQQVMKHAANYVAGHRDLTFTSISLYEIVTGFAQIQAEAKLARARRLLLQNEEIVPASADYLLAGRILGTLRRTGKEVGYSDPLIAACAIERNIGIVTGNQKHFKFIQDIGYPLELANWRDP